MAKKQSKYAAKGGPYKYSEPFLDWQQAVKSGASVEVKADKAQVHVAYCARLYGPMPQGRSVNAY